MLYKAITQLQLQTESTQVNKILNEKNERRLNEGLSLFLNYFVMNRAFYHNQARQFGYYDIQHHHVERGSVVFPILIALLIAIILGTSLYFVVTADQSVSGVGTISMNPPSSVHPRLTELSSKIY